MGRRFKYRERMMIENSMFYMNFEASSEQQEACIEKIKEAGSDDVNPIYLLKKPIIDKKADYDYKDAFVVLMPKHKMIFINFGDEDDFEEFQEDFIEDMGYISKKYDFIGIVGRPRKWQKEFVTEIQYSSEDFSFKEILRKNELTDKELIRRGDILISLATGSINEAERLGVDVPNNILDQIKRKIILFDGEQTKFIFDEPKKKRITIQGLAGTGKTELLLHKIKELYIDDDKSTIVFTYHNVILADSLKKRVPEFFNFMKVEEQIQWEKRLWVMRSWGSYGSPNSGVYSYICNHYNISFSRFSYGNTFDSICKRALDELNQMEDFEACFDYILIDESQDFSEGFFKLCEKVTRKCVYVAGDIFQDIFEDNPSMVVNPDFLLNKCYRTDPRTLMGAHAIGMGLFENTLGLRLRWLEDDQWEACGYDIKREKGEKYIELYRKPLKRFEDIDMSKSDGVTIISSEKDKYLNTVLNTIEKIRENNPTVLPDDIGIIFMENSNDNFELASKLQLLIREKYNWKVNIGYETKEKVEGTLFISNRNNVKGLEFPFVICIMQNALTYNYSIRNSIYMMLTRSFLTSYLILPDTAKNINLLEEGIGFVNRKGFLKVEEPSDDEKRNLANAIINRGNLHKSLFQKAEEIMDEMGVVDKEHRDMIHQLIKVRFKNKENDENKLRKFIQANSGALE